MTAPKAKGPAKKEPVRNKGGKTRKDTYRRKELWEARQAARLALQLWEEKGRPEEVVPVSFHKALDTTDQARLTKWFPLIVKKGRPYKWRLGVLLKIMAWDDPVLMLKELAGESWETWGKALKDAEVDPSTEAQEEVIRVHFRRWGQVHDYWLFMLPPQGTATPETVRDLESTWKANKDMRF